MKSIYTLILFFLFALNAHAQNLLSNGNFENGICPTAFGQISNLPGWSEYYATPDYYNSCATLVSGVSVPANNFGNQAAASGNGYAGIYDAGTFSNYREHIHAGFPALTIGAEYEISLSVSLADDAYTGTNGMGVYFYQTGLPYFTGSNIFANVPQISFAGYGPIMEYTKWVRLSAIFNAPQAYEHLVLGGFLDMTSVTSANRAWFGTDSYYYIDSVVLKPFTTVFINYMDTVACAGETITVPYTVAATAAYNTGNVISVEMSDINGSFATPVTIGSITSTTSGSITAVIPATTPTGTGYLLRLVTSSPSDTSINVSNYITVNPHIPFNASSNAPLCAGNTLNLTATTVAGATYNWTGPNSFVNNSQSTTIGTTTISNSGNYVVTATINGCVLRDTAAGTINPIPVPTITGATPVCPGTTLLLNATALPGTTFSWTGPASFAATGSSVSIPNADYINGGIYEVTATLNGCLATATRPVVIQITTATPVSGGNNPVCEGFPLNLTATCATPSVSYNWTGPSGFTSNSQNPTIANTVLNNAGDYIVKATVNGCTSLPDTVSISVLPKPYLGNYASPNDTVCDGTVVTFVTVPMAGIVNPSFQWFKNGTMLPGETNLTLIAPYATGDSFFCRTFCQNQCGDNLTLYSNKVGMTIMPIIYSVEVNVVATPSALPGVPVTFTAMVNGGGYNPYYQWKKNGNIVFGANSAIFNTNNLAPYDEISVCVVSSDPCAATRDTVCSAATIVNFPTSVGNVHKDDVITLYPNPNDGSFKLKIPNSKVKSIEVVNVSGQVVYHTNP
ncbi:MAG: hypothetical protein EOP51_01200, partial [Sphingobacteriales bacterium]